MKDFSTQRKIAEQLLTKKEKTFDFQGFIDKSVFTLKPNNLLFGISLFNQVRDHCRNIGCTKSVLSGQIISNVLAINEIQHWENAVSNYAITKLIRMRALKSVMNNKINLDFFDSGVYTLFVETCTAKIEDRLWYMEKSRRLHTLFDHYYDNTFRCTLLSLLNRNKPKDVLNIIVGTNVQEDKHLYRPDVHDHYGLNYVEKNQIVNANLLQLQKTRHPLFVIRVEGAEDEPCKTYIEINIPITFYFIDGAVTWNVHVLRIGIFSFGHPLYNYAERKLSLMNSNIYVMSFFDLAQRFKSKSISGIFLALHYIHGNKDVIQLTEDNEKAFIVTLSSFYLSQAVNKTNVRFISPQSFE